MVLSSGYPRIVGRDLHPIVYSFSPSPHAVYAVAATLFIPGRTLLLRGALLSYLPYSNC